MHDDGRNPVVVIPGVLGSEHAQSGTGRTVWGAFSGDYADPGTPAGARLIALPMERGLPLENLRDDIVQAGALGTLRLRLFGLPIGVSAYVNFLLALGRGRHGFWTTEDPDDSWLVDPLDPDLWEAQGWGLANPKAKRMLRRLLPEIESSAERREVALEHQRKCLERAQRIQAALDLPATPPRNCEILLVLGDAIETPARVQVWRGHPGYGISASAPGDEVVLRSSVLADERLGAQNWGPRLRTPLSWARTLFLFEDHLGLTKSPIFLDNLLFFLLEEPRVP